MVGGQAICMDGDMWQGWYMWQGVGTCGRVWGHVAGVGACDKGYGHMALGGLVICDRGWGYVVGCGGRG